MTSLVVYDCYMAALAHNVLKMVRRGVGLPGPVVRADVIAAKAGHAEHDSGSPLSMSSARRNMATGRTKLKPR